MTRAEISAPDPYDQVAWQYTFNEGELLVTESAQVAYDLLPSRKVTTDYDKFEEFRTIAHRRGLPGTSIIVTAPGEIEGAAGSILNRIEHDEPVMVAPDYFCMVNDARIDVALASSATKDDRLEDQESFFKTLYGSGWSNVKEALGSDVDYSSAIARVLPEFAQYVVREAFICCMGLSAFNKPKGNVKARTLVDAYCDEIATSVRKVLWKEHPEAGTEVAV